MNTLWQRKTPVIKDKDIQKTLAYIDGHWDQLIHSNKKDNGTLIGLPHDYIIPSAKSGVKFIFEEQYYWDTFFILLGLNETKHKKLAKGMIENLVYLYRRFQIIPNASRFYFLSRSQPPLLTSMIILFKEKFGCTAVWFDEMMSVAEEEYFKVWMGTKHPNWRKVGELNRYYDINALHDLAEAESGWDMTPRFSRRCLDYYPVDLNALLYKYEKDIAEWYRLKGNLIAASEWEERATHRAHWLNELLWGRTRKFYFDYDVEEHRRGLTWSLAGFFPLWAGMVDGDRAHEVVKQLGKFEKTGGLVTTTRPIIDLSIFGSVKTQWAYPNGWAPLQWLVIGGLSRYGYDKEARRLAKKWLKTCTDWYLHHGELMEKFNVVDPHKLPLKGVYPNQTGFGWTNGVYVDLVKNYV